MLWSPLPSFWQGIVLKRWRSRNLQTSFRLSLEDWVSLSIALPTLFFLLFFTRLFEALGVSNSAWMLVVLSPQSTSSGLLGSFGFPCLPFLGAFFVSSFAISCFEGSYFKSRSSSSRLSSWKYGHSNVRHWVLRFLHFLVLKKRGWYRTSFWECAN